MSGERNPTDLVESLWRSRDEPVAFVDVYRRFEAPLVAFLARRTFDAEAAVDLCAETFAQAFASRSRFRGRSDDELAGWLWAIARKQLARYARKGYAETRAIERLGVQIPDVTNEDIERIHHLAGLRPLRALLAEALTELPPEQRYALQLRVVEERGYPEIARLLDVSEPTARARVSRALRKLAHLLDRTPHYSEEALT